MSYKYLDSSYDLELGNIISRINERNYKLVLVQFPDGLKMYGKEVVDLIRSKTQAEVLIWFGSCFGACDVPHGLKDLGVDFVVRWGHNMFRKKVEGW